jgi:hypothetical protein
MSQSADRIWLHGFSAKARDNLIMTIQTKRQAYIVDTSYKGNSLEYVKTFTNYDGPKSVVIFDTLDEHNMVKEIVTTAQTLFKGRVYIPDHGSKLFRPPTMVLVFSDLPPKMDNQTSGQWDVKEILTGKVRKDPVPSVEVEPESTFISNATNVCSHAASGLAADVVATKAISEKRKVRDEGEDFVKGVTVMRRNEGAACEKNVVEKRDKKEKINDSDSDNDLSE